MSDPAPRRRGAGLLYLAAGVLPLVAVANPALFDTWSADPSEVIAIAARHHGAWLFTTWLLIAGFAVSIAAVTVLAGLLDTALAWVAAVVHVVGATLLAVTSVFGLAVTQSLFDRPLPDWYLPVVAWVNGLDTTTLGVLWPAAQVAFGVAVVRGTALPRWAGWSLIAAGVVVLAQMAVLGGVIPAPMFMASAAVGVAALLRHRTAVPAS